MNNSKSIEAFFEVKSQWREELIYLRSLFQATELEETYKWKTPIYTIEGKNVAGMTAFKSHVAIWFHQGVFLKDENKKLINAQEGVTKALRQWRFDSLEEIQHNKDLILAYLEEAIENQKLGKELKPIKNKPLDIPVELQQELDKVDTLKTAFESLNLTKKREFVEYIATAKRPETKMARLEKIVPMIEQGIGLNDQYK
ncbi:MAG: YdeI/OmpD-associated family protein [Crocinitomicaceae bacterium]